MTEEKKGDWVIEHTHDLLKKQGYNETDLERLIDRVIDRRKKRMKVELTNPYTGEKYTNDLIDFVYVVQHNIPWKIIFLEKMKIPSGDELRFYYYILNYKLLEREGKLQMLYGRFGPHILVNDLHSLIEKAKAKGMI